MEKTEVLSKFSVSAFTGSQSSQVFHVSRTPGIRCGSKSTVRGEQDQCYLMKCKKNKSMGSDDVYPRVLKDQADMVAKTHSIMESYVKSPVVGKRVT